MITYQWVSVYLMFLTFSGFVFYMEGYFPLKFNHWTAASWSDLPSDIEGKQLDVKELYIKNKTRVVLMVIDALRYDFVNADYMPYTAGLIYNGTACFYKAKAETPTVTMPRIKAMTTGSVSNYVDVVLNFGSSAVTDDSFINQGRLNHKNMVFYGDETWLRLFPDMFNRSDGTTSFFVSDYTEVDQNVTRHLPTELPTEGSPNWDLMILHYLGLDHIGHLEGPSSPKIGPKMREMDGIVQMINTAAESWGDETVLIVCGDHGMKDSGGHGGASHNEVTVPLVITQKKGCFDPHASDVNQIDIALTVSYLLGVPLPIDSTGKILPQVLVDGKDGSLATRRALYAMYYNNKLNSMALKKTLGDDEAHERASYKQYLSAVKYHFDWLSDEKNTASAKMAAKLYQSSISNMSEFLSKIVADFDMFAIVLGCELVILVVCTQSFSLFAVFVEYQPKKPLHNLYPAMNLGIRILAVILASVLWRIPFEVMCGVLHPSSFVCEITPWGISFYVTSCVIIISCWTILRHMFSVAAKAITFSVNVVEKFLFIGTFAHTFLYFGTSFIEEEHQTWYYLWITEAFFVFVYTARVLVEYIRMRQENSTEIQDKGDLETQMRTTGRWLLPQWILLMILHRFLRTLNQTGDKWAFLPDTGDWLNKNENQDILFLVTLIGIMSTASICLSNIKKNIHNIGHAFITLGASLCIVFYRATIQSVHLPYFGYPPFNEIAVVEIFWVLIMLTVLIEFLITAFNTCDYTDDLSKMKTKNERSNSASKILPGATLKNRHPEISVSIEIGSHPSSQLFGVSKGPKPVHCLKMEIMSSRTNILLNIVILTSCLYQRPHNLILVPSLWWTSRLINQIMDYRIGSFGKTVNDQTIKKNLFFKTIFHYWIGAVFFFYQGNSNSIATADLSAGYVGLDSYIPSLVALKLGFHTYCGPILAFFLMFADCVKQNVEWHTFLQRIREFLGTYSFIKIFPLAVYLIIAMWMRHHLFVWTVISPKLFYDFTSMFFALGSVILIVFICSLVSLQVNIAKKVLSAEQAAVKAL